MCVAVHIAAAVQRDARHRAPWCCLRAEIIPPHVVWVNAGRSPAAVWPRGNSFIGIAIGAWRRRWLCCGPHMDDMVLATRA